jgi:hypothetical protein
MERCLSQVAAHVVGDTLVVEQTLNGTVGTNGEVLVPELQVGKVHNVLGGDLSDCPLNVLSVETAARCDDLATNVLGNGGGAVKRQKDGCL